MKGGIHERLNVPNRQIDRTEKRDFPPKRNKLVENDAEKHGLTETRNEKFSLKLEIIEIIDSRTMSIGNRRCRRKFRGWGSLVCLKMNLV